MKRPQLFEQVGEGPQRWPGRYLRPTAIGIFLLIALLAVAGRFGQRTRTSRVPGMTVTMPATVHAGSLWQARIDIRATRTVRDPRLVLSNGWTEGMQVNSITPAAHSESSRDGRLVLSYGKIVASGRLTVQLELQVDPDNTGQRTTAIELDDADTPIAQVHGTLRVLP
jgi:hypothetical protein